MHTKLKLSIALIVTLISLSACKNKDKYTPLNNSVNKPINESTIKPMLSFMDDIHTVKINKILKTKRYLYINVTEKGSLKPYWIATRIINVKIGGTYFYKGGLLKTNFESKEFKRVFDKIYLVSSNLVPANHGNNLGFKLNNNNTNINNMYKSKPSKINLPKKIIVVKGSIKIADLVKNAKKYKGKTIQISGICTKINEGIMNRNWIHLADGSKNDFDLVITSKERVKVGEKVTMKGVVALNKDFGAGYKYDIILEKGSLVK